MEKSADAFRTISEVSEELELPQHVLRFWETRFPQIRPLKRAGGRRYYRPADVAMLRAIRKLLYEDGYTIKGVQRLLKEQGRGARQVGTISLSGGDMVPEDDDLSTTITAESESKFPIADLDAEGDIAPAGPLQTPVATSDLAALREALALIEDCEKILVSVRRRQG